MHVLERVGQRKLCHTDKTLENVKLYLDDLMNADLS